MGSTGCWRIPRWEALVVHEDTVVATATTEQRAGSPTYATLKVFNEYLIKESPPDIVYPSDALLYSGFLV